MHRSWVADETSAVPSARNLTLADAPPRCAGYNADAMPMPAKGKAKATEPTTLPGAFYFPYAFPKPGRYRVWVQVKVDNTVETADYEVIVR